MTYNLYKSNYYPYISVHPKERRIQECRIAAGEDGRTK